MSISAWVDQPQPFVERTGQFIGERIPVVKKSSGLDNQRPCIRSRSSGHPSHRPRAGQLRQYLDGALDMYALDLFAHVAVIDPAIAVAYDLVSAFDASPGQFGILLQCARYA